MENKYVFEFTDNAEKNEHAQKCLDFVVECVKDYSYDKREANLIMRGYLIALLGNEISARSMEANTYAKERIKNAYDMRVKYRYGVSDITFKNCTVSRMQDAYVLVGREGNKDIRVMQPFNTPIGDYTDRIVYIISPNKNDMYAHMVSVLGLTEEKAQDIMLFNLEHRL